MTKGTDVASRYQSTSSEPSPNCVLRLVTCITSRGDLKRTFERFVTQRIFHVCSGEKGLFNVDCAQNPSSSGGNVNKSF